jgi:hypothetical protein
MMIFKIINRDLKAMAVVCAESELEARNMVRTFLTTEYGLPHADWMEGATVVVKNPAVPGIIGFAIL